MMWDYQTFKVLKGSEFLKKKEKVTFHYKTKKGWVAEIGWQVKVTLAIALIPDKIWYSEKQLMKYTHEKCKKQKLYI